MNYLMHLRRTFRLSAAVIVSVLTILLTAPLGVGQENAAPPARVAMVLNVEGAIGVGTAFYIENGLEEAKRRNAGIVVLQLNTPGGLVSATRDIIKLILSSSIPVAIYVSPTGARAASAGTYMAYAAHVAAMAPGTHLGAATPVSLGNPASPSQKDGETKTKSAMQKKVLNDAVAYIRSLAQLRGRNADWAEKAVKDAATLTSDEAVKEKVVDFSAGSISDLLQQADGKVVTVNGVKQTLNTKNSNIVEYEKSWKAKFLSAITNPNIAFILLLIGFYGIVFEFWTPGLGGSGVVGAVCLLVAFAALSMLPLNYAGLGLLVLGMSLMVAEGFAPGFGILGVGGVIAFVLGGLFLFDPKGADIDFSVSLPVIISTAVSTALLFVFVLGMIVRARRQRVVSGGEYMIGASGVVVGWDNASGHVLVQGETWAAKSSAPITAGQNVMVEARDGLTLRVMPVQEEV